MKPVSLCPCAFLFAVSFLPLSYADGDTDTVADIKWTLGPNLPEFRKGGAATVLGGKVISVFGMRQPWGEMSTMYIYDPGAKWWERGPDGPLGQTYVQGVESGAAFYAIGGRSASRGGVHAECHRLELDDGGSAGKYVWSRLPDLGERRAWAPSAGVGTRLYVFGGALGGHGPTLGSVEMLDTAAERPAWRVVGNIPGPTRGWSGAAAVRGQLYLIGGLHFFDPKPKSGPKREKLADVWQLDPKSHRWQRRAPLPYRVSGFDTCVYADRYIILVGGAPAFEDFTDAMRRQRERDRFHKSYYSPFVLVYDVVNDSWRRLPSLLPVATNDIRVVLDGKHLYALGGENVEPATSNTTPWLRLGEIVAGGR